MTAISVNLNKAALLRNSRCNNLPNIKYVANLAIIGGCNGITLHPREDKRHILEKDVETISQIREIASGAVRLNIEGDIRSEILTMVQKYNVHQFTIVPVEKFEKTTQRGFAVGEKEKEIISTIENLKAKKSIATGIFVEPDISAIKYAHKLGCDFVEIHTKWYANAFCTNKESEEIKKIYVASQTARDLNIKVHLGHDLNLINLSMLLKKIKPDEVSIGHAMMVESFYQGFPRILKKYTSIAKKNMENQSTN